MSSCLSRRGANVFGSCIGRFEQALFRVHGSFECAFLENKERGLDQIFRQRRAVDADERRLVRLAFIMDRLRHEVLSRTEYTGDEYGLIG